MGHINNVSEKGENKKPEDADTPADKDSEPKKKKTRYRLEIN